MQERDINQDVGIYKIPHVDLFDRMVPFAPLRATCLYTRRLATAEVALSQTAYAKGSICCDVVEKLHLKLLDTLYDKTEIAEYWACQSPTHLLYRYQEIDCGIRTRNTRTACNTLKLQTQRPKKTKTNLVENGKGTLLTEDKAIHKR